MSTSAYHAIAYLYVNSKLSFVIVISIIHDKVFAQIGISQSLSLLQNVELREANRDNSMTKMKMFHWEKVLLSFPMTIILSRNFLAKVILNRVWM